jgi:SAM-dependent MidA family methyltransferase
VTRPPEISFRRVAATPPPDDDPGDPRLVAAIRAEIEASGPITFARFMQRALYEPGLGYYAASESRATRDGDFLTAPELHPIFGHALAGQLDEMWQRLGQPPRFVLREHGAGSGALAAAIAEGLTGIGSGLTAALDYQPVEIAGRALAPDAGEAARDAPMVGCVLANELLDALPVHRVVYDGGRLREIFVGWAEGKFVEVVDEPSSPALAGWFTAAGVTLAAGQRAEVCLAAGDWLALVAAQLERGYVLVIDYADEPAALYGPQRRNGTLRAFRGHHLGADVLRGVGRQDLTATVDLGALDRAAAAAGLVRLGVTTQAELLVGCGLEDALERERARIGDDWQQRALLRAAVARLLDPRQLGGYRVAVYGRDVPTEPPLRGLGYRLPARTAG